MTGPTQVREILARYLDAGYVEHWTARLLTDCLLEATAEYWQRRAATFDWSGNVEAAAACREHAQVLRWIAADGDAPIDPMIWDVLEEVA